MAQDQLDAVSQRDGGRRPLVAFDFDGTLTVQDSFTSFLRWRAPAAGRGLAAARLIPAAAAFLAHRDRGRIKAAAVRVHLARLPLSQVAEEAERFAAETAERLFRPDALACWREWRARGAELVIVTASPEIVVAPFARRLAADRLIGTPLAADSAGRITGAFGLPNCRGAEKVARLRAAYGPDMTLRAAYGDTSGDAEMLAIAEEAGFRRFRGRP